MGTRCSARSLGTFSLAARSAARPPLRGPAALIVEQSESVRYQRLCWHTMQIFWDNSNIYISAQKSASALNPSDPPSRVRVYFRNLIALVARGRQIDNAFVAGSIPPPGDEVWRFMAQSGVGRPVLYERVLGPGGTSYEQGVDERILLGISNALLDEAPGTMALLTGDGAEQEVGVSFTASVRRAAKLGWQIELYSWERALSGALRSEVNAAGGRVILLDGFYPSITFVPASPYDTYERIVNPLPSPLGI